MIKSSISSSGGINKTDDDQFALSESALAIRLAPEVDVSELEEEKLNKELMKFETTNTLIKKHNHANGVIEQIHINPAKFHE